METRKVTERSRRQRKFLLIAPAGGVVLLAILFGALGGGEGKEKQEEPSPGLNLHLPEAHLKEGKGLDKLAMYDKAALDSMRLRERLKRQEGWRTGADTPVVTGRDTPALRGMAVDPNVEKMNRKLAEIKAALAESEAGVPPRSTASPILPGPRGTTLPSSDVDRLERMMRVMKEGGSPSNPEIRELNGVLDKLITVQQHPNGQLDSGKPVAPVVPPSLPVKAAMAGEVITGWDRETGRNNRFYDLESSAGEDVPAGTAMEAIIPETQVLVNGAMVRLELATELMIKGEKIPVGTPLYGMAHLNNERLQVGISSILSHGQVYPVSLQVIDQDGLAGIYEPGSIGREVAKQSAGEGLNSIGPTSFDPSIGAQAASAGIQMARTLAGKKIRLVRVTVKKGYRVFLEDVGSRH